MNPLRPVFVIVKYSLNECGVHTEGIVAISNYDEESCSSPIIHI
jgi:hypothetical protein